MTVSEPANSGQLERARKMCTGRARSGEMVGHKKCSWSVPNSASFPLPPIPLAVHVCHFLPPGSEGVIGYLLPPPDGRRLDYTSSNCLHSGTAAKRRREEGRGAARRGRPPPRRLHLQLVCSCGSPSRWSTTDQGERRHVRLLADLRHVWHLAELRGAERERGERHSLSSFHRCDPDQDGPRAEKERNRRENESLA